jgi:hypothetical protein
MPCMFTPKAKIIVFLLLTFTANPLMAELVPSLYGLEILVADESADTRQAAFTQGLDEVFIRISGDSTIMSRLKRPPSSRYVQQFSYQPIEQAVINDEGEALNHRLKIEYNGKRMEKYLLDNGFSVWGEHRSDTIIWLAIRDGKNEYVLKDADQSLLKSAVDDAMKRRGVPERWPLNDYKDRKTLKVADIRGGFKDPLTKASSRYGRGPVLAGSMIWNGQQWQSSWSLLMPAAEHYWSQTSDDYSQLIDAAIDRAADAMGSVYAINSSAEDQLMTAVRLDVQSVTSIGRYRRVENYLKGLSAVDAAVPVYVDGQNAVFQVTLRSQEKAFLNLIKNDAELVEVELVKPLLPAGKPELPPELPMGAAANVAVNDIADSGAGSDDASMAANNDQSPAAGKRVLLPTYHYRLIN